MVIKKYIAQTEDLATQMAQNELGKDVVIMNVKKTTPKGLFKLFRKPHVELTAAIDDTAENAEKPDFSKLQEAIRRRAKTAARIQDGQNIRRRIPKQLCRKQNGNKCSKMIKFFRMSRTKGLPSL